MKSIYTYPIAFLLFLISLSSCQPLEKAQNEVKTVTTKQETTNDMKKDDSSKRSSEIDYYHDRIYGLLDQKDFIAASNAIDSAMVKYSHTTLALYRKELYLMQLKGYDRARYGLAYHVITEKNGKIGLCTEGGKELYTPQFDEFSSLYSPYIILQIGQNSGMVDSLGHEVIPIKTSEVYPTIFDLLEVKQKGKSGLFSLNQNKYCLDVEYDIHSINSHLPYFIIIEKNSKQGVFHALQERIIIPCDYDSIEGFNREGISFAIKKGQNILIDTLGEKVERL